MFFDSKMINFVVLNLNSQSMSTSRALNLLLIIIGGIVAIYANAGMDQNQYVLIGGIVMLMTGVYRISKNIQSKNDQEPPSDKDE